MAHVQGLCAVTKPAMNVGEVRSRLILMFTHRQIVLEVLFVNSPKGAQEVADGRPQPLDSKGAKVNTSWINPNQAYDDALQEFVGVVLNGFLFLDDFQAFRLKMAQYRMYDSLS